MSLALVKPAEWHAERRTGIGGSDAARIMAGEVFPLWLEKTGRAEPEDLSDVLPVQIGTVTEPLNLHWFAKSTGKTVTHEGESRHHAAYPWMRCTLDGLTDNGTAIVQAKHVNQFSKIDEVTQKYMPQIHHEMAVCGVERAYLSVFIGTFTHEVVEVALDDFYLAQLIDRERAFWAAVESDTPPEGSEPIAPPALPSEFRQVDMTGNNLWASSAADWLANKAGAATFKTAEKSLKELVEADVNHASGHGIVIKRSKATALSIKES